MNSLFETCSSVVNDGHDTLSLCNLELFKDKLVQEAKQLITITPVCLLFMMMMLIIVADMEAITVVGGDGYNRDRYCKLYSSSPSQLCVVDDELLSMLAVYEDDYNGALVLRR